MVNQVRGAWGKPVTLPGLARTKEPAASPAGLACFPVGGCVLVGSYKDAAGRPQAFITSQAHGTWSKIIWVPGLARLDLGHSNGQDAEATSISCTGPTKCSAGGYYQPDDGATHAFVASRP
ncbi:MAG TPA: hypothetical protein VFI65_26570 [Streptosporangiaceae bacterium]|nr:hypothetical protein [Streptosporangiaceae bacterium]